MIKIKINNVWTETKETHCTKRKLNKYLKPHVVKIMWGCKSRTSKDKYVCQCPEVDSNLFGKLQNNIVYVANSERMAEWFLSCIRKGNLSLKTKKDV